MRVSEEGERLVIQEGRLSIFWCAFMIVFSTFCIGGILTDGYAKGVHRLESLGDLFIILFLVVIAAFAGAYLLICFGYRIVLDEDGVREERLLPIKRCRSFSWADIKDIGCSFSASYKGRRVYLLYFATFQVTNQTEKTKNVNSDCISISLQSREVDKKFTRLIVPFCNRYSKVKPFLPPTN